MEKTKPSIIEFIISILLVIILIIYSIREISDFIWFIILSVKITDIDTAYNIVYFGIIDSTIAEQRVALRMNEVFPKIVSALLVIIFVTLYLSDTISYFKKLKLYNLKVNANEFNTCSSCNHDQVHFHATSCPKCGSPEVNMYAQEMKRNFSGNIALLTVIIISIAGYLLTNNNESSGHTRAISSEVTIANENNVTYLDEPILCQTNRRIIMIDRVDQIQKNVVPYRYRSWNLPKTTIDTPDVEIVQNNNVNIEGTGACMHHNAIFYDGALKYTFSELGCYGEVTPPLNTVGEIINVNKNNNYKFFQEWCVKNG